MIHLIEGSVEVTMPGYVDADGHVIEDVAELVKFLDPPFDRMRCSELTYSPADALGGFARRRHTATKINAATKI